MIKVLEVIGGSVFLEGEVAVEFHRKNVTVTGEIQFGQKGPQFVVRGVTEF